MTEREALKRALRALDTIAAAASSPLPATLSEASGHAGREAFAIREGLKDGAEVTATGRVLRDADFERLADEAQEGHPDLPTVSVRAIVERIRRESAWTSPETLAVLIEREHGLSPG